MTAWQRLIAASSLAIGTAWDLIANPKTGGAGVVVSNGATIQLTDTNVIAALDEPTFVVALEATDFTASVFEQQITVVMSPDIVAQITLTEIGAQA